MKQYESGIQLHIKEAIRMQKEIQERPCDNQNPEDYNAWYQGMWMMIEEKWKGIGGYMVAIVSEGGEIKTFMPEKDYEASNE